MKNKKFLFSSSCILFGLSAMLTGCTTTLRDPKPLRTAAVYEACDGIASYAYDFTVGEVDDVEKLDRMINHTATTDESYHPADVTANIDGATYTFQFSHTESSRANIDWEVDVYQSKQDDLIARVTFDHKNTKHPIGYSISSAEKYNYYADSHNMIKRMSDEELVAKAKEYAAPYVDIDIYKHHVVNYDCKSMGDFVFDGWYDVVLCTDVANIRCVDYTTVRMYLDGSCLWVNAPPKTAVSKMFSKTDRILGYEEPEECCANEMRLNIEQTWGDKDALGYSFSELTCRHRTLSLDENGDPVLLCFYKLTYTTDMTREVNGQQINIGDVTFFITVGVWLG